MKPYSRPIFLCCAISVYAASAMGATLLPISVGLLAQSGLNSRVLGALAFVELGAAAVAAIATSARVSGVEPFRLATIGCMANAVGNVGAAFVFQSAAVLFLTRAVAGFGSGLMMAGALAGIARVKEPERIYSLGIIGLSLLVTAGFWLAPLLNAWSGSVAGIYAFQGAIAATSGGAMFMFHRHMVEYASGEGVTPPVGRILVRSDHLPVQNRRVLFLLGLSVSFLIATADGAIWVFAAPMGAVAGVNEAGIGNAILAGTLTGSVAAPFAARWGESRGLLAPIALGVIASGVGMLMSVSARSPAGYESAVCLRLMASQIMTPMYQGLYARIDTSGRLVAASVAALEIGVAIGPLFAAPLVDLTRSDFFALGATAAAIYALVMCLTLLMMRLSRRMAVI